MTALAEQPAQVRRAVRGNALRLAGSRPDLLPPTCKFLAADAGETREPVHGLLLEKLRE